MDMQRFADQLRTVVGQHLNNVKMVVRDSEIYIDADAPRGGHDVDWVDPGFSKMELTIRLR